MNAFKRLLLILTSMAIMLMACGCSFEAVNKSSDDDTPATTTPAEATASATTTTAETTTAPVTTTTKVTTTAAATTTTAATTEAPVEEVDMDLVMGSVVDGVYINDYFNFSFAPTTRWVYYTDEELYELMGIEPSSISTADDRQKALSETQFLRAAHVADSETNVNVNVMIDNLDLRLNGNRFSTLVQYAQVDLSTYGDEYTFGDFETTTIGSNKYLSVLGSFENDGGYTVYCTLFYKQVDNFVLIIKVTSFGINNPTGDEVISWMSDADTPGEVKEPEVIDLNEVMGSVVNGAYVNEYFDYSFTPGTTLWSHYEDDELLERMGIDPDSISTAEDRQEALSQLILLRTGIFVELATNESVYFYAEDLSAINNGRLYSLTRYAQGDMDDEDSFTFGDFYEITIGSSKYLGVTGTMEHEYGYTVYKTFLYKRVDDFVFTIRITTFSETEPTEDEIISWMSDAN